MENVVAIFLSAGSHGLITLKVYACASNVALHFLFLFVATSVAPTAIQSGTWPDRVACLPPASLKHAKVGGGATRGKIDFQCLAKELLGFKNVIISIGL